MSTPSPRLHPAQRARLRKLVRALAIGIIGVELGVIALATVPAQAAYWVCTIPCFVSDSSVRSNTKKIWQDIQFKMNTKLGFTNRLLQDIEIDQTENFEYARQHSKNLNSDWDSELTAVTKTPSNKLRGVTFRDANPGATLQGVIPGAEPWNNYYEEYLASADTALVTLRTSLDALHEHNRRIEDGSALDRIASLAGSIGDDGKAGKGLLAMDELEVQSSLEVARQLQALRAQHALRATIYAVAESHRVGVEARSQAEAYESDCRKVATALAGMAGSLAPC